MNDKQSETAISPVRILLVAPDNRLTRAVRAGDENGLFDTIRFRTFEKALDKADSPADALIVQWTIEEIQARLVLPETPKWNCPVFVYCPELPEKTVVEGEEIRFTLLQYGATAVFSQLRKLPSFLEIIRRHARRFPPSEKHWTLAVEESLPWKTATGTTKNGDQG